MRQKEIKIGVPRLEKAKFTIDVNGTECRVVIDGTGAVEYFVEDFKKVNYYDFVNCKPTLDAVEKIVRQMFEKQVFTKHKRNAGSGQKAKIIIK
jgi:hypothetical protein